ncbi:MAG: ATP-binding cassette domain-containing protein [Acidimicrobiia bacterium]|nr:ATP-binding cassette domain-containing protein [Acidimicrobiia bacterium]
MTVAESSQPSAAPRHAEAVASVEDLRVHFRSKAGVVQAVDGVSFDIRDGETLGLVGETGCGKSVTARSFLRLVPMPPGMHVGGFVLFHPKEPCAQCGGSGCETCRGSGRTPVACPNCGGAGCAVCEESGQETLDLMSIPEHRLRDIRGNRIAMIFQDPGKALNPALPIGQQIAEVFYEHRAGEILDRAGLDSSDTGKLLSRRASYRSRAFERMVLGLPPLRRNRDRIARAVDEMVAEALAETQIPNPYKVMERYPHELSGGMRQRVMIAQALACNPDLLIADEPTTALDVTVQARILELVRELQLRRRAAVLYISHDLALVKRVSDRVAVMYAGRIVEIGPTEQIFHDPLHPYTRGLLAAIPSTQHERGRLVVIDGNVPELIDPDPACRFAGRCPYASDLCRTRDPGLSDEGVSHPVACFIHHQPSDISLPAPSFSGGAR